ncbi:MAG: type IV toxin-antitoxin system AbiEi family antitoxin domain-containing protein [Candidatus Omnitrophota bacterium]
MQYAEFKNTFRDAPFIRSQDVVAISADRQALRNQLNRWQHKELVIKLKKGVYILNEGDRKINPSRQFIANQLYGPSYVSLEYALNSYGLIPERVADVTSVTTRKTLRLVNPLGNFIYQHIQPAAFRGFSSVKDSAGFVFFIAEAEKAVADFLYLNLAQFKKDYPAALLDAYRFQNFEKLNVKRLMELAQLFNNRKLLKVTAAFCKLIKKERK